MEVKRGSPKPVEARLTPHQALWQLASTKLLNKVLATVEGVEVEGGLKTPSKRLVVIDLRQVILPPLRTLKLKIRGRPEKQSRFDLRRVLEREFLNLVLVQREVVCFAAKELHELIRVAQGVT